MLRGINVSGQKKILMPDLKAHYESLGFRNVITYIQSGNVIFSTDTPITISDITEKIESEIFKRYAFDVPVIIRTDNEMKSVLEANPYLSTPGIISEKIYITFLEEKPQKADIEKINPLGFLPDKFRIIEREIYIDCAGGYGTTKLSNTFFENKLKVRATTRNWNTAKKLFELANENS
jgi:uncharacterized protein (DUF1697 family)